MRNFFLLVFFLLTENCLLNAQTILLQEDFSTASGTTPPAGWTMLTVTGDPLVDMWHFDNPGRRSPASPIADPFACFDSDKLSNNSLAEEVYLISPAFDATTTGDLKLEFDQYFLEGFGASCSVEVFNGSSWIIIYTNSSTTGNPHHSSFDVTTLIQNITNAQIRFKWSGNYSWYWIIDNIKVTTLPYSGEQFTEQTAIALTGVSGGSVAWGDYDNDDDLDILLTGNAVSGLISKIYHNNGDNSFTEQTVIALTGVYQSSVVWGDYDNDGNLDILLSGMADAGPITKIYHNNGDNSFTEQTGIVLQRVFRSSAAWGDYNNDGYLDIILTGALGTVSLNPISKIYCNNGNNIFTEQINIALSGVWSGSVTWGDYDNDGNLDILLSGMSATGLISKIYHNNGDNTFTEQTGIALTGVHYSSIAWGDYDNDGDLDILLTGASGDYSNYNPVSKIYRNNGDNSFTEQTNISLPGVYNSSCDWIDYDNDGDLDIFLSGRDQNYLIISRIFTNNGNNTFSEQSGISLIGLENSSVTFGDYDNDGDLDILLTGYPGSEMISKIYKNNNSSKNTSPTVPDNLNSVVNYQQVQFSWDKSTDLQTPQYGLNYNIFVGSTPGACDIIAPMSNTANGLRNVVQIGNTSNNNFYTLNSSLSAGTYYWGVQAIDNAYAGSPFAAGTFTITEAQAAYLEFSDITTSSATISWTRGNKEKCVVLIKNDKTGLPSLTNNTTYIANAIFGQGSEAGSGWYCIYNGTGNSVEVTGLSGSNTYKVMVIEYSGEPGQEIYLTNSNTTNPQTCSTQEQFTEQSGIDLTGVAFSSVAWGDYDNDGYLDILLTGYTGSNISKIYHNNGNNTFTEQSGITLPGVCCNSSVAWGDYDNDGYLDILLTGSADGADISKIYHNNGNNTFSEQTSIILQGVIYSSARWGDYDNDGNLDILLTGNAISKIYHNNGNNSFIEQTDIKLIGTTYGSAGWGDYDNDGDLDILLTGTTESGNISKIYRNNGNNSFTEQFGIELIGVSASSVAWGDYDNDGDLDILLTGSGYSKIFRNNGDNSFAEQANIVLVGVSWSSVAWGDYDNDGYLDLLLTGYIGNDKYISKIYHNSGNNTFTEQSGINLPGVANGSVAWGDYDNDGDLDILLTGLGNSKIFQNNNFVKNIVPTVPDNLNAVVNHQQIQFKWDKSTDSQTTQLGLSYNIVVGSTPGACDIVSPMSNTANGFCKVVQTGNSSKNTYTLNSSLPAGNYYWSVQAIDNGFAGSAFATSTFTITEAQAAYIKFSDITTGSTTISWTRGNKEKCAVFIKNGNSGLPSIINNTAYIANTVFGQGSQAGTDWYCIFNGTGNSVTVTGLSGSNSYKIMVVEYSGSSGQEIYSTFTNTTNPDVFSTTEQFTEQTAIMFPEVVNGVGNGFAVWGDYDNDGDLDFLLTGGLAGLPSIFKIYRNNGDNTFIEQAGITLPAIVMGSAAWGDYNSDGFLDILLTGLTESVWISKIYKNNGDNTFIEQTEIPLISVVNSTCAWGDYDNDGDLDILLTGFSGSSCISKIYQNNGDNSFTEQNSISLLGVDNGSVAWGDYDNDGDLDILLTGITGPPNNYRISKIYRNNGDNSFTEQTSINLPGVSNSSVAWGDYDNDSDLDILLTGFENTPSGWTLISKIYRNDGNNAFWEQNGISLMGVDNSSVAWGDYDNDGNLDIFVTGHTNSGNIFRIYRNNNDNSFTEQNNITLPGVENGSIALSDYDKDGDLDILLTGDPGSGNYITKIYKNNNSLKNTAPTVPGNINAVVNNQQIQFAWDKSTDLQTPQDGLSYNIMVGSTPGACDIISPMANTSNGLRKIVQIGNASQNNFYNFNSSLPAGTYYWGVQAVDNAFAGSAFASGTFTITEAQAAFLKFSDITTSTATVNWTRGNKERCVVFIKNDKAGLPSLTNNTTYIANTVFGQGSEAGSGWYCIYNGTGNSVTVTGLSGSNSYKIMVVEYSGSVGQETYMTFTNTTNPDIFSTEDQFTEQADISLTGVSASSVAWGDYDNDGDMDFILTGNNNGSGTSKIYRNDGNNTFTEQADISLTGVSASSVAWGDYDNDNYLDILLTGYDASYSNISKIYRNNCDNTFTEQTAISLPGVYNGSVAWGDYDNNGNLDILLTGQYSPDNNISKIFKNNGDNTFTEQENISLTGVSASSVSWGDYDTDGDMDILLTGQDNFYNPISKIYRNNGDNTFSEQTDISLAGVYNGSVVWGDYDNDRYLDILLTGYPTKIYHNNGNNSFTEQTSISLTGFGSSTSAAWGDYNNDGNLDILLTGINDIASGPVSKIYLNNGNNTFTEQTGISLIDLAEGSVCWGDYDNDDDLDILLSGDAITTTISKIYRNNNSVKNIKPQVPTSIVAYIDNGKLYISWSKITDAETPQNGLTYNLRIGTTPGGCEIMSPMSLADGKRTIVAMGNAGHNTQWSITLPVPVPENIYYGVQAIDNGFLASNWAPEQSEISKFVADFLPNSACQKNEVQFQDKSYSVDYPINSYLWKFIENDTVRATSTLQNPVYAFKKYPATHKAELTITNSNGDTISRTKTITVVPSPLANFTSLPVCQGNLTSITNSTLANSTIITGWLWDFGDGTPVSTDQNPVNHSYNPGTHNLSLTVSADNGCSLTTIKEVIVAELPSKTLSIIGNPVSCSNESTLLSADYKSYYTYQWKANGALIQDSTNFKIYPKSSASYSVEISNTLAGNCAINSDAISLTVKPSPPVLSIVPSQGTSFCLNDTASRLKAPLVSGLTYNWMVNGTLASSGSNSYIPQQSGTYTLIVYNADNCSQAASNSVPGIVINPIPAVPNVTSPTPTFCSGSSFTMETPYSNESAYQWLDNGSIIPGAVQNTYSPPASGKYSVKVTKEGCSNTSLSTDVTVLPAPVAPAIVAAGPTEFCQGDSVVLSVTNNPNLTYQWRLNGGVVGSDTSSYVARNSGTYDLIVSNSDGCPVYSSNSVIVTVNPKPAVPAVAVNGSKSFCSGGSVDLSVTNNPAYTYQWQDNGSDISNATSNIFTAKNSGAYSLNITNSDGCSVSTDNVTINVLASPEAQSISAESKTEFCLGDSVVLSVTNNSAYSYQWKLNGGAVGSDSSLFVARNNGTYNIVIKNENGCSATSANSVDVTVNALPSAGTVAFSGPASFCAGGNVTLSVPSVAGYTYNWRNEYGPISGADASSYTANISGTYQLEITNTSGCSVRTSTVSVVVKPLPYKPVIISDNYQTGKCSGVTPVKLNVSQVVEGYKYQWYRNGMPISGATLSYLEDFLLQGDYSVTTDLDGCKNQSDIFNITFLDAPEKPYIHARGTEVWYLACSNDSAAYYKWYCNDKLIEGANKYFYVANRKMGDYQVSIGNSKGCFTMSDIITIPTGITGIEDIDPFEGLIIYPNPTKGLFTIEIDNDIFGELMISIITEQGKEIRSFRLEKSEEHFSTEIDLSRESKGMYIINLLIENYSATRKVIVK